MYHNITQWGLEALAELAKTQANLVENALAALVQRDRSMSWALVTTAYSKGLLSLEEAARVLNVTTQNLLAQFRLFGVALLAEEEDTSAALAQCGLG